MAAAASGGEPVPVPISTSYLASSVPLTRRFPHASFAHAVPLRLASFTLTLGLSLLAKRLFYGAKAPASAPSCSSRL